MDFLGLVDILEKCLASSESLEILEKRLAASRSPVAFINARKCLEALGTF